MKIGFFGTPQFAADILLGVLQSFPIEVSIVVSQPDRPVWRKQELIVTPVKQVALDNNIPVLQPLRLKDNRDFQQELIKRELDFIVVVAYGKIIPQSILDIPKYGCVNIHGSILPLYRGASPVQSAIKDGQKRTWLTTMYMNQKMDEGDILKIQEAVIDPEDTSIEVFQKFVQIGPKLLEETLTGIVQWNIQPVLQDHEKATYCHMISKTDGLVDFQTQTSQEIYNRFRAYQPWPGIYMMFNDKRLVLEKVTLWDDSWDDPGSFLQADTKNYGIVCADKKILLLHQVKPEWKKSMDIMSFVNGLKKY